ncbi:hypothetical protein ACK3SF_02785 [Candidatus Nanosalina sp. VS9-1]|uniref:hypothetical protein n=1 Tax=Candidatus Nanosalina sp. VS9-1 TaxID=3388566 RepID=UPI0039DFED7F
MVSSLAVDIDPQEWAAIFEGLDVYFQTDSDLREALNLDIQSVYDYRDGERQTVDIDRAGRILSVFDTVPVLDLSDPEAFVNDRYNRWGRRVDVDDEVQKLVFRSFSTEELAEKADVEKRKAVDYRNASSNPPEELWEYCIQELEEGFSFRPENFTGDILEGHVRNRSENGYGSENFILEDADVDEIKDLAYLLDRVDALETSNPHVYSSMLSRPEALQEILDVEQNPLRSALASSDVESGTAPFMRAMKELDVVEKYGGRSSNYRIKASESELKVLKYFAEKNDYETRFT